jgi:N6-adenosine-specific RNA methylase IME4
MLINNKGTKLCSCFQFSALFFNLEASLQPLIPVQDKSSCLLYIKANTTAVKKCEHTFLLWAFEMRNMIFWELLKRSVVKSRGARGAIFQKMSHCDYRLKGGEFWLKQ